MSDLKELLRRVTGGRPMQRVGYSFTDKVNGKPVFEYTDCFGRCFLAQSSWALFRVPIPFSQALLRAKLSEPTSHE